jgi:hypothetical protein
MVLAYYVRREETAVVREFVQHISNLNKFKQDLRIHVAGIGKRVHCNTRCTGCAELITRTQEPLGMPHSLVHSFSPNLVYFMCTHVSSTRHTSTQRIVSHCYYVADVDAVPWQSFEFASNPPKLQADRDIVIVMSHRGTKLYSAQVWKKQWI